MNLVNSLALIFTVFFSIPVISQTAPITISGQLGEQILEGGFTIDDLYKISPDGEKVAYRAATGENQSSTASLYIVGVNGDTPTALFESNQPGYISEFEFTPDSTKLVVAAGANIYSINLSSNAIKQLDIEGGMNNQFKISRDGRYVVYSDPSLYNIYSVTIEGGTPTLLNDVPYEKLDSAKFEISQNSKFVVINTPEQSGNSGIQINSHLYSTPIDGGPIKQLLPQGFNDLYSWKLSPDSKFLIYSVLGSHLEIFSKNLNSGISHDLSRRSGQNFDSFDPTISPDSRSVLFTSNDLTSKNRLLKLTSIDGTLIKTYEPMDETLDRLCGFNFSPTNEHIVFCMKDSSIPSSKGVFYKSKISSGSLEKLSNNAEKFNLSKLYTDFIDDSDIFIISNIIEEGLQHRHKLLAFNLKNNSKKLLLDYSAKSIGCFDSGVIDVNNKTITTCTNSDDDGSSNVSQFTLNPSFFKRNVIVPETERAVFFKFAEKSNTAVYIGVVGKTDSGQDIFALRSVKIPKGSDDLCFPVKSKRGNVSLICI